MSLSKKIDFAVIFQVTKANPNGDPLNGNRPRTTYDIAGQNIGEVSDVCIKRKIRDRLLEMKQEIYVQSDDNKVDDFTSLRARADAFLPANKSKKETAWLACQKWFDVRAFGQVLAFKGSEGKGTKGEDKKSVSIGIRGPVTVQSAFSLAPVNVSSIQITKSVSSEGDGSKRGSDTMGMKHRIDSGTYLFFGSMNPQLAVRTGFSDEDAAVIKSILPRLFENDASSARPEGSMRVLKVVWWEHNSAAGQISSAKVHGSLKINDPANPADITFISVDGPKPEVIEGY